MTQLSQALKSYVKVAKTQSFNALESFATRFCENVKALGVLRIAPRTERISAFSCAKELQLKKIVLAKLIFEL